MSSSCISPTLLFEDLNYKSTSGQSIIGKDALIKAQNTLENGGILCVKGIGGFHLICDARNEKSLLRLRKDKKRPHKPFAVIFKDLNSLKRECVSTPEALDLLNSSIAPIVILRRAKDCTLPELVSPGLNTIGAMLPYTSLHVLLFKDKFDVLIVTSANNSGEPILYETEQALMELSSVADGILYHNHNIISPLDDSVVTCLPQMAAVIIRRGRGFVPLPVNLPEPLSEPILGCGSDVKASFCLGKNHMGFPSPSVGNIINKEALQRYRYLLGQYQQLLDIKPLTVACDLNPDSINNSIIAKEDLNHIPRIEVQHHHAHIAACMGENNVVKPVIGIVYDGTGYGPDKTVWGGEFLYCTLSEFKRLAHWQKVFLPGNERAIHQPWRMALSYLKTCKIDESIPMIKDSSNKLAIRLLEAWDDVKDIWLETSSIGRLFHGVAALLGLGNEVTYEGQPSLLLENQAWNGIYEEGLNSFLPYNSISFYEELNGSTKELSIPVAGIITPIITDIISGVSIPKIAARFHLTLAAITASISIKFCEKMSMDIVALSGGVWQNRLLWYWTDSFLRKAGLKVLNHHHLSPNDECIGYGQMIVAGAKMQNKGGI